MGNDTTRPRVLLVGAYERDNFGDLLFLLQTEQYLTHADVTAAAPFPGDMTRLLDRKIPAFGPLLEKQAYDCVWTVGGEVGGTSFGGAFRMSNPAGVVRAYDAASPEEQDDIVRRLSGRTPLEGPYLPRPTAYPPNAATPSVVHSAGVASIAGLSHAMQAERLQALKEADRITVRDEMSADLLAAHGIPHQLGPDLVHTLAMTRPQVRPAEPDVALVQVSDPHLRKVGHEAFAEALARSTNLAPYRIRMFVAGTAPGHDSVESYERIVEHVRKIVPDRNIAISPARRPLDLVDEIAAAGLWIGLSLHGRIVASAYEVPRISLEKRKLDVYSQTWDAEMPYGVTPETLDDAVAEALSPAVIARAGTVGEDLARAADEDVRAAVAAALCGEGCSPAAVRTRVARRVIALESWRSDQAARLADQVQERDRTITSLRERLTASDERRTFAESIASRPSVADRLVDGSLRRVRALRQHVGRSLPLNRKGSRRVSSGS